MHAPGGARNAAGIRPECGRSVALQGDTSNHRAPARTTVTGFTPRPEKAISVMWVLPRHTSPAAVARERASASASAGGSSSSMAVPARVGSPATS